MATNVEALKNLYVTLGGNAADVADLDSNSEMIEALRNVATGGGGGGAFVINIAQTDGGLFYLDKTWNEIKSAALAGQVCLGCHNVDDRININVVSSIYSGSVGYGVVVNDMDYVSETADGVLAEDLT